MVKVQDTYNPVTGEYVKRISDWVELTGDLAWQHYPSVRTGNKWVRYNGAYTSPDYGGQTYKYDSKPLIEASGLAGSDKSAMYSGVENLTVSNQDSGWNDSLAPTSAEVKAYFYGYKLANSDGTSPYYKSEVPYTPATWAEWSKSSGIVVDISGVTITADNINYRVLNLSTSMKPSTKYGVLYNIISSTITDTVYQFYTDSNALPAMNLPKVLGNNKIVTTSNSTISNNKFNFVVNSSQPAGNSIKLKDIRIFELPTGSQIEADFTNLSADELSAKYTFNGLCVKYWKKVTDGTGLTSTLPTASYEGYTPYRMIYQFANPEISYLTPKATIPLYDTNTIVETDTPSDCRADVTVGCKLKDGVTVVAGDITAPTPDYMSAVNSVSEDGLGKGIVQSPNIVTNGNFANGTTGWGKASLTTSVLNNELTAIATSDWNGRIYQTIGGEGKYYIFADIKSPSGSVGININSYTTASVYHSGNGSYQRISAVLTSNISSTYMVIVDKNLVANAKTFFVKNVGAVNLTQIFGAGNEPTKEQCDILFATWQDKDSTQATLPTLRKIGTVADTYSPETGVLVQRIGKKVFDGTENWVAGTIVDNTIRFNCNDFSPEEVMSAFRSNMTSVNSHFKIDNDSYDYGVIGQSGSTSDKGIYLRVSLNTAGNLAQFKAWLAQQYANGTPVTVYYQLATPVVTTLATTALPTYKPTTVIESDSTVKGNVSADYKLKTNATPMAGDFIASPEAVNDIKDLGNSIDVVSSVGRRNLLVDSNNFLIWTNNAGSTCTSEEVDIVNESSVQRAYRVKTKSGTSNTGIHRRISGLKLSEVYSYSVWIKNVGTKPIEIFTNGLNNQATGYNISGVRVDVGFDGMVKFENTKRRDTYDWFQVMARTYTIGDEIEFIIYNEKFELSENSSQYTPAPEDIPYNTITNGVYKTNILLSAPLRSVGDVKDRLFKDSDGKWKVERNIGEKVFNGTEIWTNSPDVSWNKDKDYFQSEIYITGMKAVTDSPVVCNLLHQELFDVSYSAVKKKESISSHGSVRVVIILDRKRLSSATVGAVANWAGVNGLTIQYVLATPTYETLSQELQTKLDNIPTFPEHNYVYTVTNDNLQPTLHVDYKKLSWLRSRLLVNSLKIYSRNLTDAEMIQNYKVEKERFGM